jgi:hypothetical protein
LFSVPLVLPAAAAGAVPGEAPAVATDGLPLVLAVGEAAQLLLLAAGVLVLLG